MPFEFQQYRKTKLPLETTLPLFQHSCLLILKKHQCSHSYKNILKAFNIHYYSISVYLTTLTTLRQSHNGRLKVMMIAHGARHVCVPLNCCISLPAVITHIFLCRQGVMDSQFLFLPFHVFSHVTYFQSLYIKDTGFPCFCFLNVLSHSYLPLHVMYT